MHGGESGAGIGVAVALNVDGQVIESVVGGSVNAPSINVQSTTGGEGIKPFTVQDRWMGS